MPKGKIALMLPRFSRYGGVEGFGYRLAVALVKEGYSVDFICARKEIEAPLGVRVLCVGRPGGVRLLKALWFLVRVEQLRKKGQYDLSLSLGKTWNQTISRMGGGTLFIFWKKSEQALPAGFFRWKKRIIRWCSPSSWLTLLVESHQFTESSHVIAVSHLVRQWLLDAHPRLLPENVRVIYNRPDLQLFFPPSAEERLQARKFLVEIGGIVSPPIDSDIFISTATTNFELKGISYLIKAFAQLPDHTHLFIAGARSSYKYQRLVCEMGLKGRVHFCGKVDNMPLFYKGTDVFILNTFYDACSNVVLEALASGCKVVSTKNNGASFFLSDNMIIPDPADISELVKCMLLTLAAPKPPPFTWSDAVSSGINDFVAALSDAMHTMKK